MHYIGYGGHDFDSYWTKTETYEALKKYIQTDMYDLRKLVTRLIAGEHIEVNTDKFLGMCCFSCILFGEERLLCI